MISRHSSLVGVLLATLVFLATGVDVFAQETVLRNSNDRKIPLENILVNLGQKYDRHFTVEEGEDQIRPSNWILSSMVFESRGGNTLVDDLTNLCKRVPALTFRFDEQNPPVVHLIDTRLTKLEKYSMEGVIPAIDFSGLITEFVDEVRSKGFKIENLGSGDIYLLGNMDRSTQIHVLAKGVPVRSVLSNYILLETRQRILWVARTNLDGPALTHIFYRLPLPK